MNDKVLIFFFENCLRCNNKQLVATDNDDAIL